MNSQLVLTYSYDADDDFGWLAAAVETPRFRGRNGMWVQWQDLGDLAAALGAYPLDPEQPATGAWGYSENGIFTAVTRLEFSPRGSAGAVTAKVELADYDATDNRCAVILITDYPAIERFRQEIERMMRDRTGCAVLLGQAEVD